MHAFRQTCWQEGADGAGCLAGLRILLAGSAVAGMILLYAIAIWFGELNQDEGWYLYAGRLVAEGQVPYRDFASTQGPVMAYVYALAYPLVRMGGVLGGRLFTALLGIGSVGMASLLAMRMASRRGRDPFWAGIFTAALCGLSLYQVYFTTIVKTYALASCCMLAGLLLLERGLLVCRGESRRHSEWGTVWPAFAGGVLLALSAGTRLSAAFLLPACWLPIAMVWLRAGRPRLPGCWLLGLLCGGTLGILAVFAPFLLMAPAGMAFGLLDYHAGRISGGGLQMLAYKAGFVVRVIQAYWPVLAVGLLACSARGACRQTLPAVADDVLPAENGCLRLPVWVCVGIVTLVHLAAGFPYDDYQVFIMPLAAVAVGTFAADVFETRIKVPIVRMRMAAAGILLLLLLNLSGSLLQGWILGPRDRIWWPIRNESSLAGLRLAGRFLRGERSRAEVDSVLLTQDTYLAVESGFRVPAGMEMGPFSYFPRLSDTEAAQLRVLNRDGLLGVLANVDAEWAAYSEYGFAIEAPDITQVSPLDWVVIRDMLHQRFQLSAEHPDFGQASTRLRIYQRRP